MSKYNPKLDVLARRLAGSFSTEVIGDYLTITCAEQYLQNQSRSSQSGFNQNDSVWVKRARIKALVDGFHIYSSVSVSLYLFNDDAGTFDAPSSELLFSCTGLNEWVEIGSYAPKNTKGSPAADYKNVLVGNLEFTAGTLNVPKNLINGNSESVDGSLTPPLYLEVETLHSYDVGAAAFE